MSTKVWLVLDYPVDNSPVGIFTSRELADKAIDAVCEDNPANKKIDFSIHEMELDVPHQDYC